MTGLPAAVVTCSDSAAAGLATDTSGPIAADLLRALGHEVGRIVVVPDEQGAIATAVGAAIEVGARIVVTTGGTGAGPRDVTPEALRHAGLRELPGLGEAMRAVARPRTPTADLSRTLGGVLGPAVVLALPGSPGGVRDGLAAVGALLGHAAAMAGGGGHGSAAGLAGGQVAAGADEAGVATNDLLDAGLPHAGGMTGKDLVRVGAITRTEVEAQVGADAAGAVVTFAGVVRDHDRGRRVTALHYEAHPDAGRVLAALLKRARERPGVLGAAALHRAGNLSVGDLAFTAAVSAAHRTDAFDTCSWLVDEAKATLPIWKRQHFADGTDEWVNSP